LSEGIDESLTSRRRDINEDEDVDSE